MDCGSLWLKDPLGHTWYRWLTAPCSAMQTCFGQDYKGCLIQRDKDGSYSLSGVARRFCSLQELLCTYQNCTLHADGVALHLGTCCPPQPKGKARA